jgi:3-oxoacyl-[acyl-carrier protein] reductase
MNDKQVALVSGASRGIGAAVARELGRLGYHVVVNYLRDAVSAGQVAKEIGSAQTAQADVTDEAQASALIDRVIAEHGRIDVLVANANTAQPPFGPLVHLPWETFAAKVDGELAGVYHLTRRVLPVMAERRTGRIVYVSSTASEIALGTIAHSVGTAALNAFGRQVAAEAVRDGITVNTVALGAVATDATAQVFDDGIRRFMGERSLTGNVLEADEVAEPIAALADGARGSLTGQLIRIDGGYELLSQVLDGPSGQFASRAR